MAAKKKKACIYTHIYKHVAPFVNTHKHTHIYINILYYIFARQLCICTFIWTNIRNTSWPSFVGYFKIRINTKIRMHVLLPIRCLESLYSRTEKNHLGRWAHFDPHIKKGFSEATLGSLGTTKKTTTTPILCP